MALRSAAVRARAVPFDQVLVESWQRAGLLLVSFWFLSVQLDHRTTPGAGGDIPVATDRHENREPIVLELRRNGISRVSCSRAVGVSPGRSEALIGAPARRSSISSRPRTLATSRCVACESASIARKAYRVPALELPDVQQNKAGAGDGVLRPEYQSPGRVHLSTRLICVTARLDMRNADRAQLQPPSHLQHRAATGPRSSRARLAPAAPPPPISASYPRISSGHAGADLRIASWMTFPSCHSGSPSRCSSIR